MALEMKYAPVLDLTKKLGMKNTSVNEEGGSLKLNGTVNTQYQKNLIWDKIKEIGGESSSDIKADIKVENNNYLDVYTVQKGDTLSALAKKYYKNAGAYMDIFNANKDQLKNPDMIQVGQTLKIPFKN